MKQNQKTVEEQDYIELQDKKDAEDMRLYIINYLRKAQGRRVKR